MKPTFFTIILFMLFWGETRAQGWQPLGPDDYEQLTFGGASACDIAFNASNVMYVAYTDNLIGGRATVRKYDGNHWTTVGGSGFSVAQVGNISLAIDNNNTLYVAYTDVGYANKITVMKFDGTNWVTVGNAGFSAGGTSYISIVMDGQHIPYVAYKDAGMSNKAIVKKFDGTSWVDVGGTSVSGGNATFIDMAISNADTLYMVYQDLATPSQGITVRKFDGSTWVGVGASNISTYTTYSSIAVSNTGVPYIIFRDPYSVNQASVRKFDNTDWVAVGLDSFSLGAVTNTALSFSSTGELYAIFKDQALSNKCVAMKFDGQNWINVGPSGTVSPGNSSFSAIACSPNGAVAVVYGNGLNESRPEVKVFDGVDWQLKGILGFSAGVAANNAIVVDANGTPYMAYSDAANSNKLAIKKFVSGTWQDAGVAISTGQASSISMVIDNNNQPFVAYRDGGLSNKICVKMYNSIAWVDVGPSGGITPSFTASGTMTMNSMGEPYLAWVVAGAGEKVTVKKFDGTSWIDVGPATGASIDDAYVPVITMYNDTPFVLYRTVLGKTSVIKFDGTNWGYVGNPEFSINATTSGNITVDANGVPWVGYADVSMSGKLRVKQFDGANWVDAGPAGISDSTAAYISLVTYGSNNTPYITYQDAGNYLQAMVKKYDGVNWVNVGGSGASAGQGKFGVMTLYNNTLLLAYSSGTAFAKYYDLASPLSTTIEKFNAAVTADRTVSLTWKVASEKNITGFQVQKSTDAVHFTNIGFVAASGKSSYQYNDYKPQQGENYYRLLINRKDGKMDLTPVRLITLGISAQPVVYPTIASASISYTNEGKGNEAVIIDMGGKVCKRFVCNESRMQIDISELAPGTYFLKEADRTTCIFIKIQ